MRGGSWHINYPVDRKEPSSQEDSPKPKRFPSISLNTSEHHELYTIITIHLQGAKNCKTRSMINTASTRKPKSRKNRVHHPAWEIETFQIHQQNDKSTNIMR